MDGNSRHTFIGVDLSLVSPGLSICTPADGLQTCYFYPVLHRDNVLDSLTFDIIRDKCTRNIPIRLIFRALKRQPTSSCDARYHQIVTDFMSIISEFEPLHTTICIEAYAFVRNTSSASTLHELGGIFKHYMFLAGFEYTEVAPTRLKKVYAGSGRANKADMYQAFVRSGMPNLMDTLSTRSSKQIPCPVNDIVDSCALVEYGIRNFNGLQVPQTLTCGPTTKKRKK